MKLGLVKGTLVATAKHEAFLGYKLLVVQPLDEAGAEAGETLIAVDTVQAGVGDTVIVNQEGNGTRQILKRSDLPIRALIVAIVDSVDLASR